MLVVCLCNGIPYYVLAVQESAASLAFHFYQLNINRTDLLNFNIPIFSARVTDFVCLAICGSPQITSSNSYEPFRLLELCSRHYMVFT